MKKLIPERDTFYIAVMKDPSGETHDGPFYHRLTLQPTCHECRYEATEEARCWGYKIVRIAKVRLVEVE